MSESTPRRPSVTREDVAAVDAIEGIERRARMAGGATPGPAAGEGRRSALTTRSGRPVKVVNCYNCTSAQNQFYASENGFTLVKCCRCGLLFVNPRPHDDDVLQAHYVGKQHGDKSLDITGAFDGTKIAEYLMVLRDLFGEWRSSGDTRWLDIGCGHGEFLLAVQKYTNGRVALRGSEPNVYKRRSARRRGLTVDYIDPETHGATYDVVSLLNVYSHIPNPPVFLRSLRRLMKPGGELVLQTGDTAGLASADHYRPFYLPDHLSFASEDIIVSILRRVGFEIVGIRKYPLIRTDVKTLARELVKGVRALFVPRYRFSSKLQYLATQHKYGETDMYVRARLA